MTQQVEGGSGVRDCNLDSARGLIRVGGELVAMPHIVPKSGYKAKNAYGAKEVFLGETTNQYFQKAVKTVDQQSRKSKKLMPYYPNASRNRPKETMENDVGLRFGPHKSTSTERYRGQSHFQMEDDDPESKFTPATTNQAFDNSTAVRGTIGLANQGISSDIAIRTHKKLGIYE